MSTHNICFYGERRKILHGHPFLTGTMAVIFSESSFINGAVS